MDSAAWKWHWGTCRPAVRLSALSLTVILLTGCGQDQLQLFSGPGQPTMVAVQTISLRQQVNQRFTTYGRVEPPRQLSFQAPVSLPLAMIRSAGERVKKGEVVARFDIGSLQQQLALLQNALAQTSVPTERERLNGQLRDVNRQIEMATIAAPFDLVIKNSLASQGMLVEAGRVILQGVEQGTQRISASVPEWVQQKLATDAMCWIHVDREKQLHLVEYEANRNPNYASDKIYLTQQAMDTDPVTRDYFQAVLLEFEFPLAAEGCWVPTTALVAEGSGGFSVFSIEEHGQDRGRYNVAVRVPVKVICYEQNRAFVDGNFERTSYVISGGTQRIVEGQVVAISGSVPSAVSNDQQSGQE